MVAGTCWVTRSVSGKDRPIPALPSVNAAYRRSGTAQCREPRPNIRFAIREIRFARRAAGVPRSLRFQGSWDLRTDPTWGDLHSIYRLEVALGARLWVYLDAPADP